MTAKKIGRERAAVSRLIRSLETRAHTFEEQAAITGLDERTVRAWIKQFREDGLCHVADWRADGLGRLTVAAWTWGPGPDKPKPAAKSRAQITAEYKARKREGVAA